ncbi:hypothetical protein [Flavobacterium alkalisoli]|uniref:hypothetical protein n=1 Tax=Flavobacterium alkalisoli TaxID=2602769 RepID=UPI003A90B819
MSKKILLLLLVLSSCKPTNISTKSQYEKFDYNVSSNPWIVAFKDQAFFSCLRESYSNNDTIFKLIEKRDAFNGYDNLGLNNITLAKELGKKIVVEMPPPSMCEGCTEGMNSYMANCLHYYNSRELDSIAHVEYEKYIK